MFKKLLVLLASLIALPVALSTATSSFNDVSMVVAEGENEEEEEPTYTYREDPDTYYECIARYYDPCDLIPNVEKRFCAPSGYSFDLTYSDEQVDHLLNEMDKCEVNYNYMVDCVFYYGLEGTMIYSDSDPEWPDTRENCRAYILNCINSFTLFEIKELTVATTLYFRFEFQFCSEDIDYVFFFESDPIYVEPYDEYDFIHVGAFYYVRSDEHRFVVSAELINGFFYEAPSYNEHGFHTLDYDTDYQGQKAQYEITFFAHDTVPLGTVHSSDAHKEMYYSDEDIDIRARLTFVDENNVSYTYWSRPVMFGNPKLHTIIDGYYDRDFIQRGQDHTFTLDMNRNVFNIDQGIMGQIDVDAYPISLCDPDYGHIYNSTDEFPEVGQPGHYYYVLTEEEKQDYNPNDKSFKTGGGNIYVWDAEAKAYDYYYPNSIISIDVDYYDYFDANTGKPFPGKDINDLFTNVTSLPFDGEWLFNYNAWFGTSSISVSLQENYGQTVQVVSGDATSEAINLNVPDTVNLFAGGSTVDIMPRLPSQDESSVYYYEYELSKEGIVSIDKDDSGVFTVTPLAAGNVELTVSIESRLFDKTTKTITINVVDAIYNVAKIEAPSGYAPAGQDLNCALNIRGLRKFQNLDIDWDVTDANGEDVPVNKIKDNKDASITLLDAEIGNYTISASYEGVELDKITRSVRYQAENVSPTADSILLNVPDSINLLVGGDNTDVIPTISNYDANVEYYFDYELSRDNVIAVSQDASGKLTISPNNAGTCSLTIVVNYKPNHVITKTINVRVLDAIYDVSSIVVPDEFHYAGKDLTAAISIRGFTSFQNLDIAWTITNKKGEELEEGQYIDNGDATITIKEAASDDYTISASYEGILLDTILVKVRQVDMNKFLRANIWWIFLLTMSMVFFIFFAKSLLRRGKTTVEHIERVYEVLCQCLSDDRLTKEELLRIKKELTKCLHRCEDRNIEALNQYEKAIRYLRKSLFDVKTLLKGWDTMSADDKGVYTEHLDKDLSKALSVAKEIENAKQVIEDYHMKANKHNFESISDDNDGKNKKHKNK